MKGEFIMTRKLVSNIYIVVFIVCFAAMTGFMVKGFIDQNKDEKQQISRYEQMIKQSGEGSKTLLTKEILEEDHEKYLADAAKSKSTFITLLCIFGCVMVMFVIYAILNVVLKMFEDSGKGSYVIALVSSLGAVICVTSFAVVMIMFIAPKMKTDYSKDGYMFETLRIKDTLREEERYETGSGDDRRTETRVYYYLIDEKDNKISVNKIEYDRYTGPGLYYAGKTTRGAIFSLYSGEYFELAE